MPSFSQHSEAQLATLEKDLADVLREAIKIFDFTVLEGYRSRERQERLFNEGKSKLKRGKHNRSPSYAVDIAPYPVDWHDTERFVYLAGYIMAVAAILKVPLRWGGDWDRDTVTADERFRDYGHFELDYVEYDEA
jgi:peptidoglycan L-alanyl-D-glutamate endopeptidase CwlK